MGFAHQIIKLTCRIGEIAVRIITLSLLTSDFILLTSIMVALPKTRPTIPPTRESIKDDTSASLGKLPEIIILVSAPLLKEDKRTPVESLSVQKEIDNVLSGLERLNIALKVRVRFATFDTLMEVMTQREKPLILHFIGHGMPLNGEIALILEDRLGLARPFTASKLNNILQECYQ